MLKKISLIYFVLLLISPTFAHSSEWVVDKHNSYIKFSGDHAGNKFWGEFKNWGAEIYFHENNLPESKAVVTVDLSSAETGDATYDKTLPQKDWFNINGMKGFSAGIYQTTSFAKLDEEDLYLIMGTLKIRGFNVPVAMKAKIQTNDKGEGALIGKAILNRLDFEVGKKSDSSGDWVSLEIPLEIKVVARQN